jgi:predicted negative regulator of RcsB-dependent stress response
MFLVFLKSFWKEIAVVIAVAVLVGGIYYQGYEHGQRSCQEDWNKEKAEQIDAINKRVDEIKTTSDTIAINQEVNNKKVGESLDAVIARLKVKPAPGSTTNVFTTVKDCKPSDTYVETWNEISKKANNNK